MFIIVLYIIVKNYKQLECLKILFSYKYGDLKEYLMAIKYRTVREQNRIIKNMTCDSILLKNIL